MTTVGTFGFSIFVVRNYPAVLLMDPPV